MEKTYPILDYYKNKKVLHTVDGEASIEDVAKEVDDIVSKY